MNRVTYVFIGLLLISFTFILSHYVITLPDILTGVLMGMGIGMMALPLITSKSKPDN